MDRDRNLLFGVFAVQLRKVTPSQIMAAAGAWASDPSKDLVERLMEDGALTDADRDFLDRLVNEAVAAHDGDAGATLLRLGGPAQIERSFYGSLVINPDGGVATVRMNADSPERRTLGVEESPGRYSQLGETARGGMGRILLVHDEFLGRDIALKELLPGLTRGSDGTPGGISPARQGMSLLTRFLQEARITGQLEHPSIVPVYELGHRSDGTIYYTMKLVRGETLEDAIRSASTLQERLGLLNHFIDLCQGIAYAHSLKVIHRDIKPSNVMVGKFGETVVLDWGLAKVKDKEDVHSEEIRETLRMMNLGEDEAVAKTAYGEIMGTPLYMPPEQAKGQLEQVDERSDIYSLGAALYELLTGRPPFEPAPPKLILEKVIGENPTSVRDIAPEVPAELAAICEKALAKDPKKRYVSARALAEEVQRFQSGALVQAHAYTGMQLVRRFVSRHKPLVASAVVAAIAILVVSAFAWLRITQSQLAVIQEKLIAGEKQFESYQFAVRLASTQLAEGDYAAVTPTLLETPPELRGWEWGYLMAESAKSRSVRNDLVTYIGDLSKPIPAAQLSSDGIHLLVPNSESEVSVWNIETGGEDYRHTFPSPLAGAIENITGTRVLTVDAKQNAILWDMENFTPIQEYERAEVPGFGSLSPDGRTLFVADRGAILKYHLGDSVELERIPTKADWFNLEVWFDEPPQYSVGTDEAAFLFDLDSNKPTATIPVARPILSRSDDGKRIALSSGENNKIQVWSNVNSAKVIELTGSTSPNASVQWMDHDTKLAVWNSRQFLIFDTETWDILSSFHPSPLELQTFSRARSNSNRIGFVNEETGLARYFDFTKMEWSGTLTLPVHLSNPQNELLGWGRNLDRVAALVNGRVEVYRIPEEEESAGNAILLESAPASPRSNGPDVAFAPDFTRVALNTGVSGVITYSIDPDQKSKTAAQTMENATGVVFAPKQNAWVASDKDGVAIIDATDQTERGRIRYTFPTIPELAVSPSGRTVAAAFGGLACVWNLEQREALASIPLPPELGDSDPAYEWAVAVTDEFLAVGGFVGGEIWLIDFLDQSNPQILRRHVEPVIALSFAGEDLYRPLASGSLDNTAIVWGLDGAIGPKLLQHAGDVRDVAFMGRGERLLTLSHTSDGTRSVLSAWEPSLGVRTLEIPIDARSFGFGVSSDQTMVGAAGIPMYSTSTRIELLEAIPWWENAWESGDFRPRLIEWARTIPEEEVYLAVTENDDGTVSEFRSVLNLDRESVAAPPKWIQELGHTGLQVTEAQRLTPNFTFDKDDIIVRVQSIYAPTFAQAHAALRSGLDEIRDSEKRISIEIVNKQSHKHLVIGSQAASDALISSNEGAAVGAMRTISSAEVAAQSAQIWDHNGDGIGDYGTLAQLGDPDGSGSTPPFIDRVLATGTKDGYNFVVTVTFGDESNPPKYSATAVPIEFGRTGSRSFFVDESGVIRFTADGSTTGPDSPPVN